MKRWLLPVFLLAPVAAPTQTRYHLPLDPPLVVSGTFGELRSSHFHSGVDFSTRRKTGLPVYAAEKGSVSRIKVAPDGYGNAVYFKLQDGRTAVYAHLESFSEKIEREIFERQKREKSSFVDFTLEPGRLPVERGETIGQSGDSGEVPPHLHFELRDERDRPLNPLTEAFSLPDTAAPVFRRVALCGLNGKEAPSPPGHAAARIPLWNEAEKKYELPPQETPFAVTGIEADINDESSGNRCAAFEVRLFIDGELFFKRRFDSFSFDEHPHPFAVYNRRLWLDKAGIFERLYLYPGSDFSFEENPQGTAGGGIALKAGETRRIRLTARDAAGNSSALEFDLARRDASAPARPPSGTGWHRIEPQRPETLSLPQHGIRLKFPRNGVFAAGWVRLRIVSDKRFASFPLHSPVCRAEPRDFVLRNKAEISFPASNEKGVALFQWEPEKGKWKYLKGQRGDGERITAPIGSLGAFALLRDAQPPRLANIRRETGSGKPFLLFNVEDDLSGIAWRGIRIESQGRPLVYRVNLNPREVRLDLSQISAKEGHPLTVTVPDQAGNLRTAQIQLSEIVLKQ